MTFEEMATTGQGTYDAKLKLMLEPESNGRYVAIESLTSSYFIGNSIIEVLERAEVSFPNADFFVLRVGFPAAASFNHKVVV